MNYFHHYCTTVNLMKNKRTKWEGAYSRVHLCTHLLSNMQKLFLHGKLQIGIHIQHFFTPPENSRCSIAETRGLRSGRRIWCGSRSRGGRTHQQTLFCDRCHKSEHHLCARPGNAVLLPLFFSLVLYSFQIVDAISWQKREW